MKIELSPNLINNNEEAFKKPKGSFPFWIKIFIGLAAAILVFIISFSIKIVSSVTTEDLNKESGKVSLFQQLAHLITKKDKMIEGEQEDRINVLLMGIGGAGHEGAYLTDTIILASLKPSTNQVALISIPRDLAVEIPGYDWRKINNALAFGRDMNYPGGGENLTVKMVEDVTGLPIHYYGLVDFSGFEQVIDGLGGINIYVDRSFTDYEYPTLNYGFQTISFKQGQQKMNGDQALKFVRSRHGTNGEGSDFARAQRQQKVLLALKDKILKFTTLINPTKISQAISTLGNHTKANMEIWEMLRLARLAQEVKGNQIITKVFDNSPEGPLKSEVGLNGAYLLVPKAGDFSEIQYLAKNIFEEKQQKEENAKIIVQNGTSQAGLAEKIASQLESSDFNVVKYGNASNKNYNQTIIYDLTGGEKPQTLNSLKSLLDAVVITNLPVLLDNFNQNNQIDYDTLSTSLNNNLNNINTNGLKTQVDFLIVVGSDNLKNKTLSKK
jgi:LCP family protein required for cell wall assembly